MPRLLTRGCSISQMSLRPEAKKSSALRAAGCPDEVIMLLCRWMNPESLRAYARVGPSGYISWLSAAERAVVDARQSSNLMRLDNAEGMIAIHGEFGHRPGARAQAVLDAQDGADVDAPAQPAPVALRLTVPLEAVRRAAVPHPVPGSSTALFLP